MNDKNLLITGGGGFIGSKIIKHLLEINYPLSIISLDNFLVVWTDLEKVVEPKESTRFEFYNISMVNFF